MSVGHVRHERERSAPLAEWKPWGGAFGASIGGAAMHNVAVHGAVAWDEGGVRRGRPVVARLCPGAFPGARRWQDTRELRPPTSDGGGISPWCVHGRPSVAIFSLHASLKGPRTGKAPLPGKIRAPCIQNELVLAGYARRVSEKPRKSPFGNASREDLAREEPFSLHGPLESCIPRRSCHPSPPNSASDRKHGAALMARQPA